MDCKDCPYKPQDERTFQTWTWEKVLDLEVGHEELWTQIRRLNELFRAQQEDTRKALRIIYDSKKIRKRGKIER